MSCLGSGVTTFVSAPATNRLSWSDSSQAYNYETYLTEISDAYRRLSTRDSQSKAPAPHFAAMVWSCPSL